MVAKRNPRVYLDYRIGDSTDQTTTHRVVFELFASQYPRLCENFRGLCTGEFGRGRDTNSKLHYVGTKIHRIVPGQVIHGGDLIGGGSESIYGGGIDMDAPTSSEGGGHNNSHVGLLTMSSRLVRSQYTIIMGKNQLVKTHAIFGKVVQGLDVLQKIEEIPTDVTDKPRVDILVVNSGEVVKQLREVVDHPAEVEENEASVSVPSIPANVPAILERRLLELKLKMNKAKQLNNQAVLEEKKRVEDPKKYMKNATAHAGDSEEKREGDKLLHETVESAQRRGVVRDEYGSEDASASAHQRRVNEMGFYPDAYEKQKEALGSQTFYESANFVPHKPSEDAKDKLVESLRKDQDKRNKFSRKRIHDDDAADVEWINERNKQYTKKLDKAYGSHTAEIKSNIERGTAL